MKYTIHWHNRVTNAVRTGEVPVPTSAAPALWQLPVPVRVVTPPEQWFADKALLMEKSHVVSEETLFSHLQVLHMQLLPVCACECA